VNQYRPRDVKTAKVTGKPNGGTTKRLTSLFRKTETE
jgi:hypothetical protein